MDSKRLIFLTAVIAVVSGIATTDGNSRGAACVFPFLYKGQQYSQCITADRNIPWCATTDNYDTDGRWGKCPGYNCTELTVADIVFLVDQSGSVRPINFQLILEFLHKVVDSFDVAPDRVRIGMALYSTEPTNEFKLNTYQNKEDILKHIDKMSYRGGSTLTGEALDFILKNHFVESAGSRAKDNVPQIAVVITDGKSHDDVEPYAKKLRDQGITIYAIGVKNAVQKELKQIASAPQDKHVFSVSDFKALKGIYQNVVQVVCTQTDPCVAKNCSEKEKCVKNGSSVQCVAESSATCWTVGDPHYKSFDGKLFSYQGSCTYTLVQTTGLDDTLTPFSIVTKTEMESKHRGAYLKTVTINIEDVKIVVVYGDPGKVLINGTISKLPVTLKSGRIRMTKESYKGVLKTDFGVEIIFDWGESLHVTVPSSYYKNLEGLCGTYNGDESDDFSTPDGTTNVSLEKWVEAWSFPEANSSCLHACQGQCPVCTAEDDSRYKEEKYCGEIGKNNGVFAACNAKIPGKLLADCLYNMCIHDGDKEMLCKIMANYAQICQLNGAAVSKRWLETHYC